MENVQKDIGIDLTLNQLKKYNKKNGKRIL